MSSKILHLLESCGGDAQVGVILRKAVAHAHAALASENTAEAAEFIAFCSENLKNNPLLLHTEEVEDIVTNLCFPVIAKEGREALQKVYEFLAFTLASSFRKPHPKPCEIVMKACKQSLFTYRDEVNNRDHACNEFDDEEEEKKCELGISSSIAILSIYTKALVQSPEKHEQRTDTEDPWWSELVETVWDILEAGEALVCVQLAQILVLGEKELPLGGRARSEVLQVIWERLVAMNEKSVKYSEAVNENIYLILCALSDAFFPNASSEEARTATDKANDTGLDDGSQGLDLLQLELFWQLVQQGLIHTNPLTRKRCSYLMKRAVDVAATSGRCLGQGSHEVTKQPLFSWDPAQKEKLLRLWFEFFLIYETLDQVQIHVVTPAMPRLAQLKKSTYLSDENLGMPVLHSSWLCILYQRCFVHESKTVTRLGVTQFLNLDLNKSSFLHQNGLKFIRGPLLTSLHEEYLYSKPQEDPPGTHPPIGLALNKFMVNCTSQLSDDNKRSFLCDILKLICEQAWGSINIAFVSEALASIPAFPAWRHSSLQMIRDKLSSGILYSSTGYRAIIQCFFLRACLHLLDWTTISLHQFSNLLSICNTGHVLKRGSPLWEEVCLTLRENMLNNDTQSPWQPCIQEVKGYLHVEPIKEALERDDLPNREEALRVAIAMLVVADSAALYETQNSSMSDLLQPLHDVLGRSGSHVYQPIQRTDKALQILHVLLQESKTSSQKQCYSGFFSSLTILLCETLDEIFQYLIRQLLANNHVQVHDVNSISLYRSFLDALLDHAVRENNGQAKNSQILTIKIIEGRKQLLKGCQALMNSQLQDEHLVKEMHRSYTMTSILTWILSSDVLSPVAMLPSIASMVTSLLSIEASTSARLKELASLDDKRGFDGANRGRLQSDVIRSKWEAFLAIIQQQDRYRDNRLNQGDDTVCWDSVLSACLSDMSLVVTLHSLPLLRCAALLIDKLGDENIPLCLEGMSASWCALKDGWRSNLNFWGLFEAFIAVVYQPVLLQHGEGTEVYEVIRKYTEEIISQGESRYGMMNTLMSHLDNVLSHHFFLKPIEKHRCDAMRVIRNLTGILQEAALYGPTLTRSARLLEDVTAYFIRHEELEALRPILQSNSNAVNIRLPRVIVISILMKIGTSNFPGKEDFFEDFINILLDKDQEITPVKRSYVINSFVHRLKLRIWQAAIIILNFLSQDSMPRVLTKVLQCVKAENQTSVRHVIEVFIVRMIHLNPHLLQQFWEYTSQAANSKDISFSPLVMIIAHLGIVQPKNQQESFYLYAIPTVLPWTFVSSMALRIHAQVALFKMWKNCQEAGLTAVLDRFPGVAVCMDFTQNNSALQSLRERMKGNFFISHFHPIDHFSVETMVYTMPRLTLVTDDELIHPELFLMSDTSPWKQDNDDLIVPLYSRTDTLRTCNLKEKLKSRSVKDAEICEGHWTEDGSGDIQKKITPWKDSHIPGLESSQGQRSPRGHLVVVASLVDRIPNLGGLCRTCEIFGASCLVLGNLALKDHQDFLSLSVSAERWLPIREVKPGDLKDYMIELREHGYTLVGVEQTANSQSLTDFKFPQRTMLLLGKEREGIPVELIQLLDVCVEIPQLGFIRSLNVHVSGALMIWEYTRQRLLEQ
ncbi:probable methyltransferase TARBP1 [Lytechinus pictus]|uniref:probable methyltransferase TARBP1 n=1 Tax=Lytechinus pictus TaxID=7653 RepID=UPI0030B9EE77